MERSEYDYTLPSHQVEYGVKVPVDDLKVDPQGQRFLDEKRAQAIADKLVEEAIGSIVVSLRIDGTRYIVDGMHRWRAFALLGRPAMIAEVHHGLTQQEEATLFLIKNAEAKKPRAIDEYKVGLTAKLPLYVDTEEVLLAHGLSLGSSSTNSIGAVAGVVRITKNYGAPTLDRALTIAERAWGRTAQTWDGMLLGGLGKFLYLHGKHIKDEDLASKLARKANADRWVGDIHTLSTTGGMHGSGTQSRIHTAYMLIVAAWNSGKRAQNKIVI